MTNDPDLGRIADALELIAGVLTRIGMNLDDIGNS